MVSEVDIHLLYALINAAEIALKANEASFYSQIAGRTTVLKCDKLNIEKTNLFFLMVDAPRSLELIEWKDKSYVWNGIHRYVMEILQVYVFFWWI